mmetsp:Transcript_8250/g.22384  ORF Transcript_8250/g.22384 Transcript_8250/m.22384 type:complete len:80 (+) Transcript_8250:818-1057(+)
MATDEDGSTLLHIACNQGRLEMLQNLAHCHQVHVDANINLQNNEGDTPLHLAKEPRREYRRSLMPPLVDIASTAPQFVG